MEVAAKAQVEVELDVRMVEGGERKTQALLKVEGRERKIRLLVQKADVVRTKVRAQKVGAKLEAGVGVGSTAQADPQVTILLLPGNIP